MFWSFVNSDRTIIENAKDNLKNQEAFPIIPQDDKESILLPESKYEKKMITFKQEEDERTGKFVVLADGVPAGEMTYVWAGTNKFIIDHTEIYETFEGKGYGKQLVMKGIAYAKKKNVKIIPLCPYAKKVMENDESLHEMIFR